MLLALLVAALAVAGCGDDDDEGDGGDASQPAQEESTGIQRNEDNASTKLTIGSKNFTEQKVLGEIYAQALTAAGYDVSTELNLGDEKTALKALEGGDISAYPEYTGTALLSFFGKQADELPKDEMAAYEEAKAGFAEKDLTALEPTPFVSSNEVGVTKETADKLGLSKISDLEGKSEDLTLYGTPESTASSGSSRSTGWSSRGSCRWTSPCGTRCSRRARRTCRSSSRPTRRTSARASSCSRTTRACSRPTTRRSSCGTT
jgi:osmoprotectant transport system substrate-binding protein